MTRPPVLPHACVHCGRAVKTDPTRRVRLCRACRRWKQRHGVLPVIVRSA